MNWYYKNAKYNDKGDLLEFQNRTDIPDYDKTQNQTPMERHDWKTQTTRNIPLSQYMREEKGLSSEIVYMSPDEYINRCINESFSIFRRDNSQFRGGVDEYRDLYLKLRTEGREDVLEDYLNRWKSGKSNPPMVYIKYYNGEYESQEGMHRAIVAKRLGVEKMPVMIISENR